MLKKRIRITCRLLLKSPTANLYDCNSFSINRSSSTSLAKTRINHSNNFDFKGTYFNNANLQEEIHDINNHGAHKQLINLLNYIPNQLGELTKFPQTEDFVHLNIGRETVNGMYLRQIESEHEQHHQAIVDYTKDLQVLLNAGRGTGIKHFKKILLSWYEPFLLEIVRECELIKFQEPGLDRKCYGPYLMMLEPQKLAIVTLNLILNAILQCGNSGVSVCSVGTDIGSVIQTEINNAKLIRDKEGKKANKWLRDMMNDVHGDKDKMRRFAKSVNSKYNEESWTAETKLKVGSALLTFLLEVAKTDKGVSALEHKVVNIGSAKCPKRRGLIFMEHDFFEEISLKDLSQLNPRYLPMVVPPKPWYASQSGGGYLKISAPLVRTYSKLQQKAVKEANIDKMRLALDYLGSTPWCINKAVLAIARQAWVDGETIGELPSSQSVPAPDKSDFYLVFDTLNAETSEIGVPMFDEKLYRRMTRKIGKKNAELHSLRCDMNLKFMVADKFESDIIYYPHNLDFRGRAYPIPPNLSHLGSDLCRGLLQFHTKKPLGKEGLRWMKIHLCNLFGNNKISLEERAAWTESHMELLIDSAREPLKGQRWWTKAEEPFQALAVCIDLVAALDSGCPELYCSGIPVHQDGSCNGLQHYAALGRDKVGAEAVNLTASTSPQDVYSGVLKIVLSRIDADAMIPEDSLLPADQAKGRLARLLKGKVDRKVVKQTVMTSVYGVTKLGARAQIQSKLVDKFEVGPDGMMSPETDSQVFTGSMYLASLTLESLAEMFSSAKAIMDWLSQCANIVASEGHTMSWVTPLGLPVMQPYRKERTYAVRTLLQTITLADQSDSLPVSRNKQRSAFPPNYVHSLDATHMILTALRMQQKGLCFAAVHDSYWTHAGDVSTMGSLLRECFVELYEQPLLDNLRESLIRRYPSVEFPPVPERGSYTVRDVLKSDYFFH